MANKYRATVGHPGVPKGIVFHYSHLDSHKDETYKSVIDEDGLIIYVTKHYIEKNPELFEIITERPPIGLVPANLFYEKRRKDLNDAIERYHAINNVECNDKWIKEKQLIETVLIPLL